jgi:tetratricopeptide (TPR) repeat protein
MRSLFALRKSEYDKAAEEVRRAVELQPDSPELCIQGASLLRRMGHYSEAEELARKALELAPDQPNAIQLVADLAWERVHTAPHSNPAKRDEAIALYERLLEVDGADDLALQRLATLKLEAGDRAGALDVAQRLVARRPGDRAAMVSLVQLLLDDGREPEALRVVLRFVAAHPEDEQLLGLAERLARSVEAWDVVAEELGSAERHGLPVDGLLAEAYLALDQIEQAAALLEWALDEAPEDPVVRYNLAGAYRRMGRLADAVVLLRELAEEQPADPRLFLMLAETLDDQDETEGALNAFNTALRVMIASGAAEAAPLRDAIRRRMATLYLDVSQFAAAEKLVEELEQSERPEVLEITANLAIAREQWSNARQAVRRLRSAGEVGVSAYLEGEVLVKSGRWNKAAERFEEAITELGAFTRVRAAEIYLAADRIEGGEALLRSWVEAEPGNAGARYYLGSYLYRTDRFEQAEAALREAFRLNPTHAPALNFLGYSLAERNDRLEEALILIQRALSVDGWNGAYLDSLGWVYFQMGRYAEARDPLERAAREYPNDGTVLEHLGDLYQQLGEPELARAAWARALDAGAENEENLRGKLELAEEAAARATEPESSAAETLGESGPPPIRP